MAHARALGAQAQIDKSHVDIFAILFFLALGSVVGFLAGLTGVGGGMLLVPFLTYFLGQLGMPVSIVVHMAIGTSLATIAFTSLSSLRAHHSHGAVDWKIVRLLVPGLLIGALCGPWLGKQIPGNALGILFACFLVFSGSQMLRRPSVASAVHDLPGAAGMLGMGLLIGTLSGVVGAGGAFVSVPFMTRCKVSIHRAVATSAALGFPIALAGTLANVLVAWNLPGLPKGAMGFVYAPALIAIVSASVLVAPLGARIAHGLAVATLRRYFAFVIFALALYMAYKSVRA